MGRACRKGCDKTRPTVGGSVDLDGAAVGVCDPAYDREAESRALPVVRAAIKAFEDAFALAFGDAVTIVFDDDFAEPAGLARG